MEETKAKFEIINMDNTVYNKNFPILKFWIALFNIFLILDDIYLHYNSLKIKLYFFQLLIGEIIILYIWLILRDQFIILEKKKIIILCIFHIIISLFLILYQIIKKDFKRSIYIIHQLIQIIFPIIIIVLITIFFEGNTNEYSRNLDAEFMNPQKLDN
jgi:hypothetical protein